MTARTFAVVDVETTGLSPRYHHRVAEVGVVQTLSRMLAGSVLVAHNLTFDARFLEHEFAACSSPLSTDFLSGLCTMRMAHTYLPGAGRSLRACCDSFSIDLGRAHSAGDDANATAQLLGRYIDLDRDLPFWAEHEQYLSLLDRALLDRNISATEGNALAELANDLGISRKTIGTLHADYMRALVEAAWSDSVSRPMKSTICESSGNFSTSRTISSRTFLMHHRLRLLGQSTFTMDWSLAT